MAVSRPGGSLVERLGVRKPELHLGFYGASDSEVLEQPPYGLVPTTMAETTQTDALASAFGLVDRLADFGGRAPASVAATTTAAVDPFDGLGALEGGGSGAGGALRPTGAVLPPRLVDVAPGAAAPVGDARAPLAGAPSAIDDLAGLMVVGGDSTVAGIAPSPVGTDAFPLLGTSMAAGAPMVAPPAAAAPAAPVLAPENPRVLFVGSLPADATVESVRSVFGACGTIAEVRLFAEMQFGLVSFADHSACELAVAMSGSLAQLGAGPNAEVAPLILDYSRGDFANLSTDAAPVIGGGGTAAAVAAATAGAHKRARAASVGSVNDGASAHISAGDAKRSRIVELDGL